MTTTTHGYACEELLAKQFKKTMTIGDPYAQYVACGLIHHIACDLASWIDTHRQDVLGLCHNQDDKPNVYIIDGDSEVIVTGTGMKLTTDGLPLYVMVVARDGVDAQFFSSTTNTLVASSVEEMKSVLIQERLCF